MPNQLSLLPDDDDIEFWGADGFLGCEVTGFAGRYEGGHKERNVFVFYATGHVLNCQLEPINQVQTPEALFRDRREQHRKNGDYRAIAIGGGNISHREMSWWWGKLTKLQIVELLIHVFSRPFNGRRDWEPYLYRSVVEVPPLGVTLGTIRELLAKGGNSQEGR